MLGKTATCQVLVSLTLASGEVPVPVALRLVLPESWTADTLRLDKAGVPEARRAFRTKPEIALEEIDRLVAAGVRFGLVLTDAGYGASAVFRQGLSARAHLWAVGVPGGLKVYPAEVAMVAPPPGGGGRRTRAEPDQLSRPAEAVLAEAPWQEVSWRRGPLRRAARARRRRARPVDPGPPRPAPPRRGGVGGGRAPCLG